MIRYILLDPQGGEGGGTPTPDLAESVKKLLAEKHGNDAMALARDLLAKNRELEADNRKYRQKVATLKAGVPEEGSIVLTGDDAKRWPKYRDLGEPAEVKARLDSGQVAITQVEKDGRVRSFRKAAELDGLNPDVFADLAEAKGIQIELKEETRDGKAVEVALVMGEGDSRTPLKQFVESNLPAYLPALKQGQTPIPRERVRGATPERRPSTAPPRDDFGDEGAEQGLIGRAAYAT